MFTPLQESDVTLNEIGDFFAPACHFEHLVVINVFEGLILSITSLCELDVAVSLVQRKMAFDFSNVFSTDTRLTSTFDNATSQFQSPPSDRPTIEDLPNTILRTSPIWLNVNRCEDLTSHRLFDSRTRQRDTVAAKCP
jgi:hypothetical protein